MKYQTFSPSEKFKNYIRYFWVLEGDQPYTHYSMADVCPELLFHLNGRFDELLDNGRKEKSFTAGFHGQSQSPRKFQINREFSIFGIYFYPQTIPQLFGFPANEISNQMPDLNTILKSDGNELEEKIANASDHFQRISIIEGFIERKILSKYMVELPVFECIRDAIKSNININVRQLSQRYFLSERQFERQFVRYAGFSPKLFLRILRFQTAIAQYGNNNQSLTEIAYETGYCDQSHFIHDFKEFSKHLPGEYFSGNSKATEWRD